MADPREDLTAEQVREILDYDALTGALRRKMPPRAGIPIKSVSSGYLRVMIGGRRYTAHRVIWLLVYGAWPKGHIDHRNGDTCDNRLSNLREATTAQNAANRGATRYNKSGFKGVRRDGLGWRAEIRVNYKKISLGTFPTAEAAHSAYVAAACKHFGSYARAA